MEEVELNPKKLFQFFFTLEGARFSVIGKPLRFDGRRVTFLVIDSAIELRRFPRVKVPSGLVKVRIEYYVGDLIDISLGGCRVGFENPLPRSFYTGGLEKVLDFILPDGSSLRVKGKVVNVSSNFKEVSFKFNEHNRRVIELNKRIGELIEKKKSEV